MDIRTATARIEGKPPAEPRGWCARVALVAVLIAAGCGSYRPPSTPFHAGPPSAHDWSTILSRAPKVRLETFETGRIRVHRADVLDLDDPRARGLSDEEMFVPVFAHLIRHDDFGDYLIDAGLDRSFQRITSGDMRGLFAYKVFALQRPGEDILTRLLEEGVAPRGIFFTHLHPDHLSGAALLPRNIRYIVGKHEAPKSVGLLFYEDALRGVPGLEEIDFAQAPAIPPLGPSVDVFGDGSVWAISTPGHTVGHVSYLVVSKSGPVLLTGDASHTRWGFEHGVAPGKFNDGTKADARRSFEQLVEFARLFPQVKVRFGHSL
jgi:N-acyl homoserine lactone hydrolase